MTTQLERPLNHARRGRVPFRLRLKAWWNGYDVHVIQPPPEPAPEMPVHDVHYEREPLPWEKGRVALAQRLWGKGFISAGGEALVHELVKPCALSGAMSVLELGAGLGGCARLMAQAYGTWVTALEEDASLAETGATLSEAAGLGKRAVISQADHARLSLKQGGYDVVFAKECFYRLADKERLLDQLVTALKPKGQLVFTDMLVDPKYRQHEALTSWMKRETHQPHPWSLRQWTDALTARRFEVRVAEDISERWVDLVREPWADLLAQVRMNGIPSDEAEALVPEGELWTCRAAAVEAGCLRVYRIYARLKPAGPR